MDKVPSLRTSPNPEAKPDEDHNEIDESANERNVEPLAKCSSEDNNDENVDTCESNSDGVDEPHADHDAGQDSPNQENGPDFSSHQETKCSNYEKLFCLDA